MRTEDTDQEQEPHHLCINLPAENNSKMYYGLIMNVPLILKQQQILHLMIKSQLMCIFCTDIIMIIINLLIINELMALNKSVHS